MKNMLFPRTALPLVGLLVSFGCTLPLYADTTSDRISRTLFFNQRIVRVGLEQSSEAESQLVWQLLDNVAASNYRSGLEELEQYLEVRTNSPWAPSLDAALGKHYFDIGRWTLALEHLELAWAATKNHQDGNGKKVADFALAHWTWLLASLGRYETLAAIIQENRTRVLDRGPLSQMWARTREAVAEMRQSPGISYQCGTFALNSVAKEMRLTYDARGLLDVPSPATGFSIRMLADLSSQLRLGLVPVARMTGEELVVPSVVHWRQNHYAAIVSRRGEVYKVVDPTFAQPRHMTANSINAEASGSFLVPADRVPANYRLLAPAETGVIFGRGNPNFMSDTDDQPPDCEGGEAPPGNAFAGIQGPQPSPSDKTDDTGLPIWENPGCSSCGDAIQGMPIWRVSEPYLNLCMDDEPLGYQPALGPRLSFTLNYNQRSGYDSWNSGLGFSSVGFSWNCSWLSRIEARSDYDNGYGVLEVDYARGGSQMFEFDNETIVGNYFNNKKLSPITNISGVATGYELRYPNGSKYVYAFSPTNWWGFVYYHYLSQIVSPEGQATSFLYEDYDPNDPAYLIIRLKYVVDPDGRTNTITYATSGFSTNLITQVTDPYGRSTSLQYDGNGLLTNITDVANMSSSIAYNELGWVTNLNTPYGTTTFEPIDKGTPGGHNIDRSVTITEPNNSKQLYAYVQSPPYEPASYGASEVPTNTPTGTLDNAPDARNSYHWGRLQYASLSTTNVDYLTASDYLNARMRHWLGATGIPYYKSVDTLSLERSSSPDGALEGQKTWYDYPNKGSYGAGDKGDHILPWVTARVLPDGSTWYQWKRRNESGWPTNIVETYTKTDGAIGLRTNTLVFNGFDLVLHIGVQGEQVVSNYFGSSYHQPDASYDALNQESRYTYNALRQLIRVQSPSGLTATNIYFTSGDGSNRLQKTIDLEINRTNSYTYYANGLVNSHTDERGLTTTNYWDNLQRLTGMKFPDGTTTSNRFTTLDLTASKDRLGYWAYTGYNSIRQKNAETNANGIITRYGLCECGALLSITNAWNTPVQMVTSFGYDNQGNRLYTYHPDATVTNWHDSLRRVITTCDAWGCRWFDYNNQGLLAEVSNTYGTEQSTVYDIEDHPIYVTDANGVTITNTFDVLGRLSTRTQPDGGVEKFGYSARGLVAYTNQLDKITYYGYDEGPRKTWETNANNEIIRYTNNAAGDLLSLTDGKNQTTKWNYDEYGRVTNKLDQVAVEILRYKYDPDSRLTNRWTVAKGDTKYKYDPFGNLTNVDYAASTDVKFQYDPLNRVTNMIDAAGTTKYAYAAGGQLWTEDGPFSSDTVTNTYNNRLRTALSLAQPTGNWTNGFGYDLAKRLTNVTSQAGSFGYAYVAQASRLPLKLSLPNTSYITNTYDSVARLTGTWLKNSTNGTLNSHQYTYNGSNQRTQQVFNAGSTFDYTYDAIGQLTVGDSATASEDRRYVYDAAWNLSYRTNNTSLYTFKVDTKNQLTNATPVGNQTYDGNGNVTSSGSQGLSYDDENRLVSMYASASWKTDFVYDGVGRLRSRAEYGWSSGSWYPNGTTYYIYDGMRVIQERTTAPTVSYTRGNDLSGSLEAAGGIGGLLGRSHGYASTNGNWYAHNFYHADGNGNITYLVNSSQTLAASYRYDPFGNTISSSGTLASANVYRFSSKEIHVNSGLYYYGYRWYHPNLQRWLNRDPIQELGDANLYRYVVNDPTGRWDAFGLQDGQTDTDRCKRKCHEWVDDLIRKGGGGFNLARTLQRCLDDCDLDPNHAPGSPLPKLPSVKPKLPPAKPILTAAKDCAKAIWDWWRDKKKDKK